MSNTLEGADSGVKTVSPTTGDTNPLPSAEGSPKPAAPGTSQVASSASAPRSTTAASAAETSAQQKAVDSTQVTTGNPTDSGSQVRNIASTDPKADATHNAPVPKATTTAAPPPGTGATTTNTNATETTTTTTTATSNPSAVSASASSAPDTTKDAELAAELARQLAAEADTGGRRPSRKRAKPEPFTPASSGAHDSGSTRATKHTRTNKEGSKGKASGDRSGSGGAARGPGTGEGSGEAGAASDTTTPAPGTHELIPGAKTVPPTGAGSGLGPDDHGPHPEDIDPTMLLKMPALLSSCADELPKFRELALRDYTTLEKVKLVTEYILKVGHVAQDVIDKTEYGGHDREAVRERAKLERHLWYYIATFTREDGRKLQQLYRALAAGRVQAEAFKGRAPNDAGRRSYAEGGRERSRAPRRPRSNPNGSQMTMKGAAILVMSESDGEPMTAKQIIGEALERGLIVTQGLTPDMTLGAQLNTDIHRKGSNSQFVKMGPGLFALRHPPSQD